MINYIILAGRAGKDFELKTIGNFKKAVGSIAYQPKKSDATSWFNVEIISFNSNDLTAVNAANLIKKGMLVLVEGKMIGFTNSEGKTYWKLEATKFDLLDNKDTTIEKA